MSNSEKMTFTEAQSSDLEDVSALVNSAYRGDSSRQGWTTEADFLSGQRTDAETLRQTLKDQPTRKIFCLREKATSKLLGCVYLDRFKNETDFGCYLGMLTVRPDLQAAGMGRMLLGAAEDRARAWSCVKMTLGVIHLRTELIAWYERRGYRKTGEIKPFPYADVKAGVALRDDLHFVMFDKKLLA